MNRQPVPTSVVLLAALGGVTRFAFGALVRVLRSRLTKSAG